MDPCAGLPMLAHGSTLYYICLSFTSIVTIFIILSTPVISSPITLPTGCWLSLNAAWHPIPARACEKVASDLGFGRWFSSGTTISAISYNWLVTTITLHWIFPGSRLAKLGLVTPTRLTSSAEMENHWGRHMTCWLQQVLETLARLTSSAPSYRKKHWGRDMTCWLQKVLETQPRLTSSASSYGKTNGEEAVTGV